MPPQVPAVSVLMSCFNGARWVADAIDSVLVQTFADFEFIIVDDGSTDNSLAIINGYARRDPRIVVIEKPNSGLADSLNVGIEQARGEWIARIDADDLCEPGRLEAQLARSRRQPSCVFVGSGLVEIDEGGHTLVTHTYPDRHSDLVDSIVRIRKFPPHSSAFCRTAIVRSIGGYRPRIQRSQDWDLWLRLSEVGQFTAVREPLVRIRKHPEQISNEASGRSQLLYSRVATTSYWLRRYGAADPVAADEETFNAFCAWVENRIQEDGLFALLQYVSRTKALAAGMRRSPVAVVAAASHVLGHPFLLLRLVRTQVFGESTTHRLAREWIRRGETAMMRKS